MSGRAVWQALLDRGVLVRDCSSWPRLDDCLRVTVGTPAENDAFLAALARGAGMSRVGHRRADHQGDVDRARRSTSTAPARTDDQHRAAVLRPHARPARPPRRLRPDDQGHRRPARRHPPHRRGRRPSRSARRSARRSATRSACAASPAGCTRSTRRSSRSPSTCPAARSCVWEVPLPRGACRSATRRSTRSWPSTSGARSPPSAASRCTSRCARGRNVHHIIEATFKGLARCLRDAVRVEGARLPSHEGRRCDARGAADRGPRLRHRQPALGAEGAGARAVPTPGSPPTTG